ncbi:MAG: MOSC domain-containing protein [Bacteroidota bacterium]
MQEIDQPIRSLIDAVPQTGELTWIGIRPERKAPLVSLNAVRVTTEGGLEGDHFSSKKNRKRQVTLIQFEHLQAVASILGKSEVSPILTRRNLVVKGINLFSLKNMKFRIGEVVLEATGYCHPCSRMEENLGPGGYNAMRGHGGITAKVVAGGIIHPGDPVSLLTTEHT